MKKIAFLIVLLSISRLSNAGEATIVYSHNGICDPVSVTAQEDPLAPNQVAVAAPGVTVYRLLCWPMAGRYNLPPRIGKFLGPSTISFAKGAVALWNKRDVDVTDCIDLANGSALICEATDPNFVEKYAPPPGPGLPYP